MAMWTSGMRMPARAHFARTRLNRSSWSVAKERSRSAAQAKWDKLQRGVAEFSISLAIGRADLFPETPIAVKGFKRVIDEQAWIISRVVHNLNGNGYTTGLELEVRVSDVEYESEEVTQ